MMIEPERIKVLRESNASDAKCVVYWMQQSQRTVYNHALEYAIAEANRLEVPLLVYFGLTGGFPEANLRSYTFMLEGLVEVEQTLKKRGIKFFIEHASPESGVVDFVHKVHAALLVCDRGYLKIQKKWRISASTRVRCRVVQVESDVVVPVETVTSKEEYAAQTIRPKIHRHLNRFLVPLKTQRVRRSSLKYNFPGRFKFLDLGDIPKVLKKLDIDRSVGAVSFKGGMSHAKKLLNSFLRTKLSRYGLDRNEPSLDGVSGLSPYLHFGQISPLYVALKVQGSPAPKIQRDVYIEELVVRRELSMNFCFYNDQYDSFDGLPLWAKKTLLDHQKDKREYIYSLRQFESAQTHDPIWNAAQRQMLLTGKMHGYMRMYWGKKILEWVNDPRKSYEIALFLNNKYELDGRDPNGYAGVAWCFGKHDRPWGPERRIFGFVRFMNQAGIQKKCDWKRYISLWNR